MRRFTTLVAAAAVALGLMAVPAFADSHEFDLTVKHKINGIPLENALGLDLGGRDLPVDVYLNGDYVTTFSFGESIQATLPAGDYYVDVKVAGTDIVVLELGSEDAPVSIPGGVDVEVTAKRTGEAGLDGIGLKVKIK